MQTFSAKSLIVYITFIGLFSPMLVFAEPLTDTSSPSIVAQGNETQRQLHTRSLAATCTACHNKQQKDPSLKSTIYMPLYGMNSTYFISQMLAFKSGERYSTVMQRHAKGLTAEEISDLAAYFASQRLNDTQPLPQQKLLKSHPN